MRLRLSALQQSAKDPSPTDQFPPACVCVCLHGLPSRRRVPPPPPVQPKAPRPTTDACGRRLTATARTHRLARGMQEHGHGPWPVPIEAQGPSETRRPRQRNRIPPVPRTESPPRPSPHTSASDQTCALLHHRNYYVSAHSLTERSAWNGAERSGTTFTAQRTRGSVLLVRISSGGTGSSILSCSSDSSMERNDAGLAGRPAVAQLSSAATHAATNNATTTGPPACVSARDFDRSPNLSTPVSFPSSLPLDAYTLPLPFAALHTRATAERSQPPTETWTLPAWGPRGSVKPTVRRLVRPLEAGCRAASTSTSTSASACASVSSSPPSPLRLVITRRSNS